MKSKFTAKYSLGQSVWFKDNLANRSKASRYEVQCITIHHNPTMTETRYFLMGWFREEDLYETRTELLAAHPDIA